MHKTEKYEFLDSLRGIGCLTVVIAHLIAIHPQYGIYASGCGKIGVWLLLVISGFLLTIPYVKNSEFHIVKFYLKRIKRIYPSLIVVLVLGLFLGFIKNGQDVIAHIFILEGAGHLWAIPVEIKFYIIVPIVLLLFKFMKKRSIFYLILSATVVSVLLFPYTTYIENSISLTWYMPVFFIGMLLAFAFVKYYNKIESSYLFDLIICAVLILFLLCTPYIRQLIFSIPADRYLQNKYLYFALGWMVIIFCCQHSVVVKPLLENNRFLKYIGSISFPLYLVHYMLLFYFNAILSDYVTTILFTVILSCIIASIIHVFIEKPFIAQTSSLKLRTLILLVASFVVTVAYDYTENQTWENRLYVPTMIQKIGNEHFIMDCWNHRVLYSSDINKDIKEWKTLTDDTYLGGHSIASDGEMYVLDNTDRNQILVYLKDDRQLLPKIIHL